MVLTRDIYILYYSLHNSDSQVLVSSSNFSQDIFTGTPETLMATRIMTIHHSKLKYKLYLGDICTNKIPHWMHGACITKEAFYMNNTLPNRSAEPQCPLFCSANFILTKFYTEMLINQVII